MNKVFKITMLQFAESIVDKLKDSGFAPKVISCGSGIASMLPKTVRGLKVRGDGLIPRDQMQISEFEPAEASPIFVPRSTLFTP